MNAKFYHRTTSNQGIMFPHGDVSETEFEFYCVRPARLLRQGIWSQLQSLDGEYRQYESEIRCEITPD